jgi:hypothetical protein
MFKQIIKSYYKLLDERISGTIIVLIIALLIVLVSFLIDHNNNYISLWDTIKNII